MENFKLPDADKRELMKYSMPVRSFLKILDKHKDNVVWYYKDNLEDQVAQWELMKEKAEKEGSLSEDMLKISQQIQEIKKDLELIIIQSDGELYGVYIKGIPLSQLKTAGGKAFNEVVAKQVGIYNPMRNSSIGPKSNIIEINEGLL